jgi:hypothetical protein
LLIPLSLNVKDFCRKAMTDEENKLERSKAPTRFFGETEGGPNYPLNWL